MSGLLVINRSDSRCGGWRDELVRQWGAEKVALAAAVRQVERT